LVLWYNRLDEHFAGNPALYGKTGVVDGEQQRAARLSLHNLYFGTGDNPHLC
jgi:hypothetical protein